MSFFSNILSKVSGKKKSDDFDDFDDDDDFDVHEDLKTEPKAEQDDGMEHAEGGVPAPSAVREEEDYDFDDDDDPFGDNKPKKSGGSKKKIIISAAVLGLLSVGGGAYWYFFMGNEAVVEKQSDRTTASLALGAPQMGGLTPQQKLSAPETATGGKLSVGGAPTAKLGVPESRPKLTASAAAVVSATVGGGMGGYDPNNEKQPLSTAAVADVGINIPAVIPTAFKDFPAPQKAEPLPPAMDEGMFETSSVGKLPIISDQGMEPWKLYARPYKGNPEEPAVGLVVSGLGMSTALTQAAIELLPNDVTLAFSPYGSNISGWVTSARAQGHEVLLELPMEADSFPVDDPGPMSMLSDKGIEYNLKLLSLLMAQAQGYTGFVGTYGSEFTKDRKAFSPILSELKSRGLFFMDPRASDQSLGLELADQLQLARAIADTNLHHIDLSASQLRAQLETLATIAGSKRVTAAIIPATPTSIKTIVEWAQKLKDVHIVPMSSLAGRQKS